MALATLPLATDPAAACLGEYQLCKSGECTLFNCSSAVCKAPTPCRFHACLIDAGAMHSMCSYNSLNGVPTCADPNQMNGVLRKSGWKGWVVSDYDAYASIFKLHNCTKTMAEGAAAGLNAGLDQGGTAAISQLQPAIEQTLTNAAAVTTAFALLMRARILLGMFDPPSSHVYDRIGMRSVRTAAATALNKRAALEGITGLKNGDGKAPLLPLKLSCCSGKMGSLFVAGPTANLSRDTLGNYDCGDFTQAQFGGECVNANTSIVGGLKFGGTGLSGGELLYIPGCSSTDCLESDFSNASAAEIAVVPGTVSLHVAKDSSLTGALTANVTTKGGPLTTSFRCMTDDAERRRLYSSEGPKGNTWTDKDCKEIPLCTATNGGQVSTVRTLLRSSSENSFSCMPGGDADVDEQDKGGRTALMMAAEKGIPSSRCSPFRDSCDSVVEVLLKAGARTDLHDKDNKTALDYAEAEDVKALLRAAAKKTPSQRVADAESNPKCGSSVWIAWIVVAVIFSPVLVWLVFLIMRERSFRLAQDAAAGDKGDKEIELLVNGETEVDRAERELPEREQARPQNHGGLVRSATVSALPKGFPSAGLTVEALKELLQHLAVQRHWTTNLVCMLLVKQLTCAPGWRHVPTCVNEAEGWYKHSYVNEETDEETEAVPPGTRSYCELLVQQGKGDQVGEATVFVSHAWKYGFFDVVQALVNEFGGTGTKLWFDIATVNEHTGMDGLEGDWAETFKVAVKRIGKLTLVMSPWEDPIPMRRSWCLWEMYAAIDTQSEFSICFGGYERERFLAALDKDPFAVSWAFVKIDSRLAQAGDPKDKEMIDTAIEKEIAGGHEELNRIVLTKMQAVLTQAAVAARGPLEGDSAPWTSSLHECLAARSAELAAARDLATQSARLFVENTTVDETSGKESTATAADMQEVRGLFADCVDALSVSRQQQGDDFPAVFERVKVALKLWSSIPNDPRTNPEWNMCPDRGISGQLIDACGPAFKIVWWRILKTLGYIPRSSLADDTVVVTIYQIQPDGESEWLEVDAPEFSSSALGESQKRVRKVTCKVRMSLDEANAAVIQAGLKGVEAAASDGSPERAMYNGDLVVYTYFFSHRWLRGAEDPPNPDSQFNLKAQALVDLGRKESSGYEYFFWIDFTCVDQERWPAGNPAAGVAMLPLYTANCNSLVLYDHPEYEDRGWTRAERVLFAAFNMPCFDVLSPLPGTLSKNYTKQDGGKETRVLLPDSSAGALTNPEADRPLVEQLQQLAASEWANSWRGTWNRHYYGTVRGMKGIERLQFGVTEVQMYDATPGSQASGI